MHRFEYEMMNDIHHPVALVAGLVLAGLTMFLSGCNDFLSEGPKGQVGGEVVESRNGVTKLLTGAYNALKPFTPPANNPQGVAGGNAWRVGPAHWPFGTVASDLSQKGSASFDQSPVNALMQHRWTPTNSYFNPLWANRFEGVSRANSVLKTLAEVDEFSESEAARIEGEARFLRAYFYFDLKKNFGNPPLITDTTEDFNQPNNIQEEVIWPQIEKDLEFAMNNLPTTMPDQARANKWAAEAYLAKAHLYQEEWDEALNHFDNVIQNGVTATGVPYALEEQYNYNFNSARQGADWSEVVFAVEFTGDDGTGTNANAWASSVLNHPHQSAPFTCCGFFQPSHDLVNSFKTSSEGLPEPEDFTTAFNGMSAVLKNDQTPTSIASDTKFSPATDASLDPRLDWTVGRRGLPYMDHGPHPGKRYDRAGHDYAGPYHAQKHIWWNRNADTGVNTAGFFPASGVDYPTMRFADVLLMAAEAEIQSGNGSMGQALEYVNDVRRRAANPEGFVQNSDNTGQALAVVDSESALLNTNPSPNDWVVRTDENSTYVYLGGDPSNIESWNKYPDPTDNYNIDTYTMQEFQSAPGPLRRVYFERKLELAMEGHRMYDLWRWGRAETRMNEYFSYQGKFTTDVNTSNSFIGAPYYPIPQTQIDISTVDGEQVLKQNPEY
jgi:hypothetical protein